jgi:hypothetical protein
MNSFSRSTTAGVIYIALGAMCYGALGTIVHLAYQAGYSTSEVTVPQYVLGISVIAPFSFLKHKSKRNEVILTNFHCLCRI